MCVKWAMSVHSTLGFEKAENLKRGLKVSESGTMYVGILKYVIS